jgi:serine/threonine protein kinase
MGSFEKIMNRDWEVD